MIVYESHPKVSLFDLTADLAFEFGGLPLDAIAHYLNRAARVMCQSGDLVRHKAIITTVPGVDNYLLEPDDDSEIVSILGMRVVEDHRVCGGITRVPSRPQHLPITSGCGVVSWFEAPNTLYISNSNGGDQYEAQFSTTPDSEACAIDRVLADKFYETLIMGARSFIFATMNKPWTNPELALACSQSFTKGVMEAKLVMCTGGQRGAHRAIYERVM
jgi:hypothetical protein